MLDTLWILDERGEPTPVDDLLEWARWYETANRVVTHTWLGNIIVSTIFLGIDHSHGFSDIPVLWETWVFGGKLDGTAARYTSREAALDGHDGMVMRVADAELDGTEER